MIADYHKRGIGVKVSQKLKVKNSRLLKKVLFITVYDRLHKRK